MSIVDLAAGLQAAFADSPVVSPALIRSAELGFAIVENARVQATLGEFEIERAFRKGELPCRC